MTHLIESVLLLKGDVYEASDELKDTPTSDSAMAD